MFAHLWEIWKCKDTSYVPWYLRPAVYSYRHRVPLNVLLTENPLEQISPSPRYFALTNVRTRSANLVLERGLLFLCRVLVQMPHCATVASCSTTKRHSCFHRKHCQGVAESPAWRFARSNDRTRVCHDRSSERSVLETWEHAAPESSTTAPTVPAILATTAYSRTLSHWLSILTRSRRGTTWIRRTTRTSADWKTRKRLKTRTSVVASVRENRGQPDMPP